MDRWVVLIVSVVLVVGVVGSSAQAKYGGGTGEPNDPYLIYTAEQMNEIGLSVNSDDWDKCFKLMADIDLSAFTGTSFNIIGYYINHDDNKPFIGVFDGNGHMIYNFTYVSTRASYTGLFGYIIGKGTEIRNLGLINPHVDTGEGWFLGSLVGLFKDGTVNSCYVDGGTVSGSGYFVGGLIGRNHGTITNCYSSSSVNGGTHAGGLVGYSNGTIINSYSVGRVLANGRRVGGLVGGNDGSILSSYSESNVSGNGRWGGLVGENNGLIINCYSVGSVSGGGGLVGADLYNYGVVRNSFWDIQSSGQTSSAGGTGKTTKEMKTASTFFGWVCSEPVWMIDEGNDYPRLWWENKPGEPLSPKLSDLLTGDGSNGAPFLVYTTEDFNKLVLFLYEWNKHFKLMADINLAHLTGPINVIGIKVHPFTGVFDGNGHTISNFTSFSTGEDYIGLFGYVCGKHAQIKNLGLIDPNIDDKIANLVGSLVGCLNDGTIMCCYVEGGRISANSDGGGLVGQNHGGTITNSYSAVSTVVMGDGCFCYCGGGLVGLNGGTISHCYSVGEVLGDCTTGGLVGSNYDGQIVNSFWDIETSGQTTSAGGTGKTTAEMQMASSFTDAGWDFVGERINGSEDIWMMTCEGMSYPKLNWWQPVLGDYFCPDGVDMIDMEHLALHWLDTGCDETNDYCDWAEISNDNTIDFTDFAILADNWLLGR